ncbi:MAG: hypothetical protein JWM38_388 [Sphingomonas bacterium]|jgi:DNA repair protein RadC|nr:hypothetical protein [Sphingomonas bacterium]MDB5716961.1 hypothetical protein [Sphingomonas bacterium]
MCTIVSQPGGHELRGSSTLRIGTSEQAAALFAPTFGNSAIEELRIAHLDADRCLLALRLHGGNHSEHLDLPLKAIAQEALVIGSHGLLIAHNHPSGDPAPSRADIDATRALSELTRQLDIRLYDHLIFADGSWRSLLALGLL